MQGKGTCSSTAITSVYILRAKPELPVGAQALGARRVRNGEFKPGELIPGTRYRVLGLLGVGGMGTVYEVEHTELGKRFVLKALLSDLALREDLVLRLRNEQRALGRLEHPSIVTVTDAGVTSSNVPYFVMERLDGETLGTRLRRSGCLPIGEAIDTAAAVLEGLAAAHEIGVVHRDIKPQNIFLASGRGPKILDFGVAKIADTGGAITARGVAVGTPRYMSPEQASGEPVDGRSDVYAVGLLLYESIVGKGPFDDARDANEMLLAHLSRAPPRLSAGSGSVTRELDDFIATLLAKEPAARPRSAGEAAVTMRSLAAPYRATPSSLGSHTVRMNPVFEPAPTTHADGVAARHAWSMREGSTEDAKTLARLPGVPGPNDTLIDEQDARGTTRPLGAPHGDDTTLREPTGAGPATRTEILTLADGGGPNDDTTNTRVPVTPTNGSRTLDPIPVAPASGAKSRPARRGALLLGGGALALAAVVALFVGLRAGGAPSRAAPAASGAQRTPAASNVTAANVVAAQATAPTAPTPSATTAPVAPSAPTPPAALPGAASARAPLVPAAVGSVATRSTNNPKKLRVSRAPPKIPDGLPSSGL